MAAWRPANQRSKPRDLDRMERDMGCAVSPRPVLNLMQNCDLPPPVKLFTAPDDAFLSSVSKIYNVVGGQDCLEKDKLELLRALRLSQTRAREAEREFTAVCKEKEALSNLMVQESLRLFAHRQWVGLLELQVSKLQRQLQENGRKRGDSVLNRGENLLRGEDEEEGSSSKKWRAVIVFCLAVAGMGLAFGCRYLF
ncbi:uncharacterized protein LOC105178420 [Sesamum indicum]|uniref:Uncharacterized protein LOC105178420 n=1 Tax=Sesamum indicum TaxID=4182 RepID=A0A6I9UP20_SESIN|nr:uncharacterized protein LOC105178420 [Sesamum indicum]